MNPPGEGEVELEGGKGNTVVRVGQTVRRQSSPATATLHRFLLHLRQKGIDWVPEPLGWDEQGREILSFVPDHVPHDLPNWLWEPRVLSQAAKALRALHDASVDFDTTGAVWGVPARAPAEVICHNDFAPYNVAFTQGELTGIIDFDVAAPGSRLWDLAYAAYRFVSLMPSVDAEPEKDFGERSTFTGVEQSIRLGEFLQAYAAGSNEFLYSPAQLVACGVTRLDELRAWTVERARELESTELAQHAQMYRVHSRWLQDRFG